MSQINVLFEPGRALDVVPSLNLTVLFDRIRELELSTC